MKNKDVVGEGRAEAEEAAPVLGNRQTYVLWELQSFQVALLRLVDVWVLSPVTIKVDYTEMAVGNL